MAFTPPERQRLRVFGVRSRQMVLPRGITGFNVLKNLTPADERQFVADCWTAVSPFRGRVERFSTSSSSPIRSYLARAVRVGGNEFAILLNNYHPWIGFCKSIQPATCLLDFLDHSSVRQSLVTTGRYRVLEKDMLERPLSESMCGELGQGELTQIKYWKGMLGQGLLRVGDVVFNFWD